MIASSLLTWALAAALAQTAARPAPNRPAAPVAVRPASATLVPPASPPLARNDFIRSMDIEYSKMDADKNGQLTRAEIEQFQRSSAVAQSRRRNQALFAALDADRNGQVSAAEFARLPSGPPRVDATGLLRFDTSRDGGVSLIEHRAGTLANFDRLDSDKNGSVTPAEMKAQGIGR